jgi:hypothetical protein
MRTGFTVLGGLLLVTGVFVFARPDSGGAAGSSHPQPRFIESPIRAWSMDFDDAPSSLPIRLAAAGESADGDRRSASHMVGAVAGVALTSTGISIVLDAGLNHVRLYDSSGVLVERFGREGEGPGEFKSATALAVSPRDEVAVYDLGGRIQVFARKDGSYQLLRTLRPGRSIRSMCYLGDRLVVSGSGLGSAHMVATMDDRTGEILASFGEVYKSPNPLINVSVSEGRVACDPAGGRIFFGTRSVIGELRAYDADGAPLWRTSIRPFNANILKDAEGGFTIERSPTGIHALHALTFVPNVGLFAQYSFRSEEDLRARVGARADHTIMLDARTGAPSRSAEPWPLIGAIRENLLVSFTEEPAPGISFTRIVRR